MCKNHDHDKKLISDLHSHCGAEFTFGKKPYAGSVNDDVDTAQCRKRYESTGDSQALLALGDALAHQMRYNEAIVCYKELCKLCPDDYIAHRKLAVRYLSVLDLDGAEREFAWCAQRTQDRLDVDYLRAITSFCKGDYCEAIKTFEGCYALCKDNGEMYAAVLYWHIQCLVKSGRKAEIALEHCFKGLDGGHHVGYMRTIELFLSGEDGNITPCSDELNECIFRYGQCAYYQNKGDYVKAAKLRDSALALDTYFSCFAYLGAFCESRAVNSAVSSINEFFAMHGKVALAYSGGVDSALLLYFAADCGAEVKAYCVRSQFQPYFETDDAIRLASDISCECRLIDIDILKNASVAVNAKDRCYHCKKNILSEIAACAKSDGFDTVIDGTNADDDLNERAGARALKEAGALSPLRLCGFTKLMIRELSQKHGLFTFDKPSYSCLATRVAAGTALSAELLKKIENAEAYLFDLGYKNFRVRVDGQSAKIEIDGRQEEKFKIEQDKIFKNLAQYFDSVSKSEITR